MDKDINLLYSKKQLSLNKLALRVRFVRWIAFSVFFLVAGVSMMFFLLLLASPLPELQKTESDLTAQLSQSHDKILKQTLLSIRLTDIAQITAKRSAYGDDLASLRADLPASTTITDFAVEKNQVTMSLRASNLEDLQTYFDNLNTLAKKKKVLSQAFLNSLEADVDKDGQVVDFSASISLTLL
ncbi:MAG TPA: hypothetical protein VG935_03365 [Patescibacteria group bacterium]|nr:hypothetical protein [Patescibacteria group bacterium]